MTNGVGVDQVTTYGYDHTQQTDKLVVDSVTSQTVSHSTFSYDLQGRMSQVVVETYTAGTLSRRERTSYHYDAQGFRVSSTHEVDADVDGTYETSTVTRSRVDHASPPGYAEVMEEVVTENGQQTSRTVYTVGHDQIAQTVFDTATPDGVTLVFHTDGHGSVRVLTNLAAAVAQFYVYDAYGNLLNLASSAALTSYLYSGEQFDSRIGQQYLRARWYDPATGRFNRLDPFFGNSSDPQSFHKYGYVHGDPISGVDPSGQFVGLLISITLRGGLLAGGFGAISYAYSRARGLGHDVALQNAKIAAYIGFSLAVPYIRGLVQAGLLAKFSYDLLQGDWDAYTAPEVATYILWAVVVNKGIMPPLEGAIGLPPVEPAPVTVRQNAAEVPASSLPGTLIIGSTAEGSVGQFLGQFTPSPRTGFTAIGDLFTGDFWTAASDAQVESFNIGTRLTNGGRPLGLLRRAGGHRILLDAVREGAGIDPNSTAGFSIRYIDARTIEIGWNSGLNSRFGGTRSLPVSMRGVIRSRVAAETGLRVIDAAD
ncbi:MAG: RHS repeat-associated core domain-containing protein [Planctomycetaceae bacterium]